MTYVIRYAHLLDTKAIAKFPKSDRQKIKTSIERKLSTEPMLFGKPLRRSLRGYWSLRVGEYRVIYRIQESDVLIFVIAHRSLVYETAKQLLG